ncbi:MAG TPA: vanomycin resistance protein VanB [Clostridiaceae bacterium]|nr:vanomycin resistance protein VanB [Clostridiaceae bacterium]
MLSLQWLRNRKGWIFLIFFLLVLLPAIIAFVFFSRLLNTNCFYKGITIDNIDVSGLDRQQAVEYIDSINNERIKNWSLQLEYDNNAWIINDEDIGLVINKEEAIEKAYNIGRTGNYIDRIKEILDVKSKNINIETKREFDKNKLRNIILEIKETIDMGKANSKVYYDSENNTITIEKHQVGKKLNVEENIWLIEKYITGKIDENIKLIVEEEVPDITYESIQNIKYVTSSFSTTFNQYETNRTHNIKLACEKINGTIIMPGEIFSMNSALGERTEENGFKEAPVILKNKFVQETGGGICQVSTTVYVAALKAGMEIIERQPHSMPLGYVKPGLDATIAGNEIDLKFRNNLGYPICLWAYVQGNKLNIKFLGSQNEEDYIVELKSEIIEIYEPDEEEIIIDDSLEDGVKVVVQEARKGMKVIVYKEVYSKTGEPLNKEKISEDIYWPVRGQIKINSSYLTQKELNMIENSNMNQSETGE